MNYHTEYDEYWSRPDRWGSHSFADARPLLKAIITTCGKGRILDVGCGMGRLVEALNEAGIEAHGVDVARRAVEDGNRRCPGRFHAGSILKLPFADQEFDTVVSTDCLEHLAEEDVPEALAELRRVCRHNVYVQLATIEDKDQRWHLTVRDRAWWEARFFEAGFRKHPLSQAVQGFTELENDSWQIALALERIPDEALALYPLDALREERDLHMDMLRESGPRSDAHVARYQLASNHCPATGIIVDAACGLGYGSALLAMRHPEATVIGVDNSPYAVEYARRNFASRLPNLDFQLADVSGLDFLGTRKIDFLVSFETIEHIADPARFLDAVVSRMSPDAGFIGSVPNLWVDAEGNNPSPYHLQVFNYERFVSLIRRHWESIEAFRQNAENGVKGNHGRILQRMDPGIPDRDAREHAEWWILTGRERVASHSSVPTAFPALQDRLEDVEFLNFQAVAFQKQEAFQEAARMFERCLKLQPGNRHWMDQLKLCRDQARSRGEVDPTAPLLLPTGVAQLATMVGALRSRGISTAGAKVLSIISCFNEAMNDSLQEACANWGMDYLGNCANTPRDWRLDPSQLSETERAEWRHHPRSFVSERLRSVLPELRSWCGRTTVVPARPNMPEDFYYLSALNPSEVILVADGIQNSVILRTHSGPEWTGFNAELATFPGNETIWCPTCLAHDTLGIGKPAVIPSDTMDSVYLDLAASGTGQLLERQVLAGGQTPRSVIISQHFALSQLCSEEVETGYYTALVCRLKECGLTPILFKPHPRDPLTKLKVLKSIPEMEPADILFVDARAGCIPIECMKPLWEGQAPVVVGSSSSALLGLQEIPGATVLCADQVGLPEALRSQILHFAAKHGVARWDLDRDASPLESACQIHEKMPVTGRSVSLLVVSHEASRTGAPIFLLNLVAWLRRHTAHQVRVVVRRDGPLLARFQKLAETHLVTGPQLPESLIQDVDLIYSNTCTNGSFLQGVPGSIPVLTHVHELEKIIQAYGRENIQSVIRQTHRFIACSKPVAENLEQSHQVDPSRIVTVNEAIDSAVLKRKASELSSGAVRQRLGLSENTILIGGSGFADRRKGPDLFIQVADLLRDRLGEKQVAFLWVGRLPDGAEGEELKVTLNNRGRDAYIHFVGEQENPHAWIQACSVFLLTSREDPFPLAALEAAALGMPIVCFDHAGGMPDFCRLGAGFAVPFLDVSAMAAETYGLCRDDAKRRRMGMRAVQLIARKFDIHKLGPCFERVILETATPSVRRVPQSVPEQEGVEAGIHVMEAQRQMAKGDLDSAVSALRRGIAIEPNSGDLLETLGSLLFQQEKFTESMEAFGKVLSLEPNRVGALVKSAAAALRLEDVETFENHLGQALKIEPENRDAHALLGALWFQQKQYERASKEYEFLLRQKQAGTEDWMNYGVCRYHVGDKNTARASFEKVLTLEPGHSVALENLKAMGVDVTSLQKTEPGPSNPSGRQLQHPDLEEIGCPFCHSFHAQSVRKAADIVRCDDCDTVYLRTRMTLKRMEQLYQSYADDGSHMALPVVDEQATTSALRREYFLDEILQFTPAGGKLLDVGCGWGAFLLNARDHGFEPAGMELTRKAVEYANRRLQIPVVSTQFLDTDYAPASLQVVTMLHVLEHLPQPREAIEKVFNVLRPGGMYCGIVPNFKSFCSQQEGDRWFWLDPNYHYVHYTPETLKRHLEDVGFVVERIYTTKGDYNIDILRKVAEAHDPELRDPARFDAFCRQLEEAGHGEEIRFFVRKPGEAGPFERFEAPAVIPLECPRFETNEPVVSIVIPLYNAVDYTRKCLEAIGSNTGKEIPFEIVLVDNASSDETEAFCREVASQSPRIQYHRNASNEGFARACNRGAKLARGRYLLFLNNDTEPQPGWLAGAVARLMSDDRIGAVGAKLIYPDQTIQHCGIEFFRKANPDHPAWPLHRYRLFRMEDRVVNQAGEVPAVTGACLLISRKDFKRCGGFPTDYHMYFEDLDLCMRLKEQGKTIFYEPACVVIHHEGKSSAGRKEIDELNRKAAEIFFSRWQGRVFQWFNFFQHHEDGKYVYLSRDVLPDLNAVNAAEADFAKQARMLGEELKPFGPFYFHCGGAGDALLLLSTFYDREPEATVISLPNAQGAMRSFFEGFPKLKRVVFLPEKPHDYHHLMVRLLMRILPECKGMGVTPYESYQEWNQDFDIFQQRGVIERPQWTREFTGGEVRREIVLAPKGSGIGMVGSKQNRIHPEWWPAIVQSVRETGCTPVIIGVPEEADLYPALEGCEDRRSRSFPDQMRHIASALLFVGADSWGKTFSALCGKPTIVFDSMRGADWRGRKDASDFVFIDPWKDIHLVRSLKEFTDQIRRLLPAPAKTDAVHMTKPTAQAAPSARAISINWLGSFLDYGSLSQVNRSMSAGLGAIEGVSVHCVQSKPNQEVVPGSLQKAKAFLSKKPSSDADITVRHAWPPDWSRPERGKLAVIQPWEFGRLPQDWVRAAKQVDAFWVPSQFVRRIYIESGVAPEKVEVLPNGIDPTLFHPEAKPLPLKTRKKFRFLFVGGTILRKGPDVLLKAYLESFTAQDDVCLVIKDFGGDSVYAGQTFQQHIREAQKRPNAPEILYLNEDLPPEDLPRLYTACDCLVHPYRGEGFGLPVLEAMACGLPVIVTAGGPTDEFVPLEAGYHIPSIRRVFGSQVSNMDLAGDGWMLEPDVDALKKWMQQVIADPDQAKAKGQVAHRHAHECWTWKHSAEIAAALARQLAGTTIANPATAQPDFKASSRSKQTARPSSRRTVIELPPVARLGQLKPARDLLVQKKLEDAWNVAQEALAIRPFHPEAYLLLAEIAWNAGQPALVRQCADRLESMVPKWKTAKKFFKSHPIRKASGNVTLKPLPKSVGSWLSVCLITKNEEQFLGSCLKSVRGIADQIVVVDTGSTDRTVAIAREHGAEVYEFAWCDDFSAARNAALEKATGDWVLMLDADEELDPESREQLGKDLRSRNTIGWRLPIIDRGLEAEGRTFVPRLFRNAPGLFYISRVHEQVFSSVEARRAEWNMETKVSNTTLIHHGYNPEVVKDRNKIERNLKLLEIAIDELPDEPGLLMNYGLELIRSGKFDEGLAQYEAAFDSMSQRPDGELTPEIRETLLSQYATHLTRARRWEDIVQLLDSPLAQRGGLAASQHFALGLAFQELERWREAVDQFRLCIRKKNQPCFYLINPLINSGAPRHCLAQSLWRSGDIESAAKEFAGAVEEDGGLRPLRMDYARFLVEQKEEVEALRQVHELVASDGGDVAAWAFGGSIALSSPDFVEFARDWTAEALKHHASNPELKLQRAELLTLTQQFADALPFWRQVPKNAHNLSGRILCELMQNEFSIDEPPVNEREVSQEFLNWFRRLVAHRAEAGVLAIQERLETLRTLLPSAVHVLESVLNDAHTSVA